MPVAGSIERVPFWFIRDGDGVPYLSVYLRIRKESTGQYLQLDGLSFGSIAADILMTEADPSGMPGYYYYLFDQGTSDPNSGKETYTLRFSVYTSSGINEETFRQITFEAGGSAAAITSEDFGGMIVRSTYDRSSRGYKPLFKDSVGMTRLNRTKKLISNQRETRNPLQGAAEQAGGMNKAV